MKVKTKMRSRYITCLDPEPLVPEALVSVLNRGGYAAELMDVQHGGRTGIRCELAVGSNMSRIFVGVSEDFHHAASVPTDDWELARDLAGPEGAGAIRRLINIRGWELGDVGAVDRLTEELCASTRGTLY